MSPPPSRQSIAAAIAALSCTILHYFPIPEATAVHVRAWVNPLVYPRADSESGDLIISIFSNMDDAENIGKISLKMKIKVDFTSHFH